MTESGSVVAQLLHLTHRRLVELGCDEVALAERVGAAVPSSFRHVPFSRLCELVEAGAELTDDPALGLRLSLPLNPRQGGLLVLLMLACRDVKQALHRLVRYQRIAFDAYRVELEAGGRRLVLTMPSPERAAHAHLRVWFIEDTLRGIGTLTGVRPVPRRVRLPHRGSAEPLRRAFGCPVDVGSARTVVEFEPATLRRPLVNANELFRESLEHEVRRLVSGLPERVRWSARTRAILVEELRGDPSLRTVAARLGLAERTLQRRLASEGTTVATLLDAIRQEEAERLLAEGHDIAEVSYRLGYATPSSFHRAFRRWFGTTPGEAKRG